ncbi:MAG: VOC family protein [Pseudomonadota bacterium]
MAEQWYSRPVFFVADLAASLNYYLDFLGFEEAWAYEEEGRKIVAQVNRGTLCEIILAQDPPRAGGSRLFIELEPEEMAAWQSEISQGEIPVTEAWWGYPVLVAQDPDGNELYFPREADE